jgi:hypothetical protein
MVGGDPGTKGNLRGGGFSDGKGESGLQWTLNGRESGFKVDHNLG